MEELITGEGDGKMDECVDENWCETSWLVDIAGMLLVWNMELLELKPRTDD